ncbi:pirin family protein [Paenibacillus sp. NPDC058071]|uniref:pirin family protein n=1 Tax=Paenibacillus sp. NPDC058071 TaxID=3346326 RepID=UPI0036D89767
MIKRYPAGERRKVDLGWLKSALSFSFGEYFDPDNTGFGVMRVLNDDTVAPSRGFGAHPHSDMEIVTIPLSGRIKHEDSLGNIEVMTVGEIQRMSAGTGIIHAEYNDSDQVEGSFLQLWFMPKEKGLTPSYQMTRYDESQLVNRLHPVVTSDGAEGTVKIHQDMTIYLTRLQKGKRVYHSQTVGRRAFAMVIEGQVTMNGVQLEARDTVRAEFEPDYIISANEEGAFVLFIDLP